MLSACWRYVELLVSAIWWPLASFQLDISQCFFVIKPVIEKKKKYTEHKIKQFASGKVSSRYQIPAKQTKLLHSEQIKIHIVSQTQGPTLSH